MAEGTPVFSVIVPTFGRPSQLAACLDGLARMRPPAPFEVVVADDGGSPPAASVASEFEERLDVSVVRNERGGPGAARNHGAAQARGRYLAFLDDDCIPSAHWLGGFDIDALDRAVLLGGATQNALPDNLFSTASQLINQFVYEYYRTRPDSERFFPSNNMAMARDEFLALGGFGLEIPASTSEDKELCDRWRLSGRDLLHAPDAQVAHAHKLSGGTFIKQHFAYGRGIVCFRVLRRERVTPRQFMIRPEPWRFYVRLILHPFSVLTPSRGLMVSTLVAVAQVATLAGAAVGAVIDLPRMKRHMQSE